MYRALLVAGGGLFGSVARYWLTGWIQNAHGGAFPFGTLAVNITGSFIIGIVMTAAAERGLVSSDTRLLLGTGFCGGFTTMSAFSYETVALLHSGSPSAALANVGLSLVLCVAAVWLGILAGRLM